MTDSSDTPNPRLGNIIFKNTLFVTAGNLVLKLLSFLFGIFVIRQLGDGRFGQYATVLAFVGLFQIFAEMGVTQYVMREIARDRSKVDKYFWNLIAVQRIKMEFDMHSNTCHGGRRGVYSVRARGAR